MKNILLIEQLHNLHYYNDSTNKKGGQEKRKTIEQGYRYQYIESSTSHDFPHKKGQSYFL